MSLLLKVDSVQASICISAVLSKFANLLESLNALFLQLLAGYCGCPKFMKYQRLGDFSVVVCNL